MNGQAIVTGNGSLRKRSRHEKEILETSKVVAESVIPRTIGLFGGISFIVGTIIGAGIFISPRGVAANSGSTGMTLLVWFLCGVISLLGALCYAELGTIIKSSGGDYSYLDKAFGALVSFQYSWFTMFLIRPLIEATLALTFAEYIMTPLFCDGCGPPPDIVKQLLACMVLLILAVINIFSVKLANKIQIIFTVTKLTALLIIIGGGIVKLFQGHTENLKTGFEGTNSNIGSLLNSFYSGMFSYIGWNTANYLSEEMINLERNLPLSIIIGVLITTIVYVMVNVSFLSVLNIEQLVQSSTVAFTWAEIVMPKFSFVIPIFVALSCFGTCNGILFSGGRLIKAAAQNDHLPNIFSMVHITSFTPVTAILFTVLIAMVITFIGEISSLVDSLSFLMLLFDSFGFLSVIVFRFKANYKDLPRPIKLPIIIPISCFLITLGLVIIPLAISPKINNFYILGFVPIGYMFYFLFVYIRFKLPCMDKVTKFFQIYFRVFKPV